MQKQKRFKWGWIGVAVAIVLTGCKGTANTVEVEVSGPGMVTSTGFQCEGDCTLDLPLNWLQSQLLMRKSATLVAQPADGYELFGWLTYAAQCGTEPECKVSVQAGCDDTFDLRSYNVPCEKLVPDQKWVTAAFVEKDSVALRASSGPAAACIATTLDEIRCWGIDELEDNVPVAVNPTALKMTNVSACIKDDIGLKCWGSDYYLGNEPQPPLIDPIDFAVSYRLFCAIDQGEVICWGPSAYYLERAEPPLSNPTRIAAAKSTENMCVIDDVGLHCWGAQANPVQSAPLGSETTIELPNFRCEVTADIFECSYVKSPYSFPE